MFKNIRTFVPNLTRSLHKHHTCNVNKRMIGNVANNENIQKKELCISKKEFDIIKKEFDISRKEFDILQEEFCKTRNTIKKEFDIIQDEFCKTRNTIRWNSVITPIYIGAGCVIVGSMIIHI